MKINIVIIIVLTQLFHFSNAKSQIPNKAGTDYTTNKIILFPSRYLIAFEDSLFLVSRGSKFGIIDSSGRELVPLIYDEIKIDFNNRKIILEQLRYFNDYFYNYWADGNESEEEYAKLLELEKNKPNSYLNLAKRFRSNPFFPVKKDGQWGIINKQNELIVPILYDYIQEMGQDIFLVKKEGKSGVINSENNIIVPLTCDTIEIFQTWTESIVKDPYCYALLKMDNKFGVINLFTQKTILPKFDHLELCYYSGEDTWSCFIKQNTESELYKTESNYGCGNVLKYQIDNKLGLLCVSQMLEITPPVFDSIKFLYRGYPDLNNIVSLDGRTTFLTNGNTNLHPYFYDEISWLNAIPIFRKQIEEYNLFFKVKVNGNYEILTENGEKCLNPKWDDIIHCTQLSDTITFQFIVNRKDKFGVVDNHNKIIVPIKYDKISLHSDDNYHYYYLLQQSAKSKKIFIE